MDNILLVFTEAKDSFLMDESYVRNVNIPNVDIQCVYHQNNTTPLPKLFNGHLNAARSSDKKYDFIVFMHGDVKLDLTMFINRLIECKSRYDVVGLAGTKKMNVSMSPLNWFTSSHPTPDSRYGDITMNDNGTEKRCYYNYASDPHCKDTEVACIDGLCIAIGKNVIYSDILWDENIADWDFYDTDFCLACKLKYKFTIGVIVQQTKHISVGRSITTKNFLENEKKLRTKWGLL